MHRWRPWGRPHDTALEFFQDLFSMYDDDYDSDDDSFFGMFLGREPETPEDLRREASLRERELRGTPLPTDCAFLAPWFRVIRSSLMPYKVGVHQRDSHDVRVGRDESDLWITTTTFVRPYGDSDGDPPADVRRTPDTDARLQREALYLTSLLGEIDHGAWLGELLRTNDVGFLVPMEVDLNSCELPRQFEMSIVDDDSANRIHKLFTDNAPLTVEFRKAFAKLSGVAKTREQANLIKRHYRIPVRLVVSVSQSASPSLVIRLLNKVLALVEGIKDPSTCGLIGPSMLRLESIELCMGNVALDASFLAVIERVIQTGVKIRSLVLPRFLTLDVGVDDPYENLFLQSETRLAWSSFVRTVLLGSTAMDTVQINLRDIGEGFVAPLFSALAHTRGVRRLVCCYKDTQQTVKLAVWLAFALFSRASTHSITSLALRDVDLRDGVVVDYIYAFARAQDPFHVLWGLLGDDSDPPQTQSTARGTEIRVDKGTVISVLGLTEGSVATMRLQWDVIGTMVKDDDLSETLTLLIDGIGFCRVKKSSLSSKKRRIEGPTGAPTLPFERKRPCVVHTVVIDALDTRQTGRVTLHTPTELQQTRHQLERLIRLFGPGLRALSLSTRAINDSTLREIVRCCKHIKSLRISKATLQSMASLVDACRGRSSLTSLDLHGVRGPIAIFESFLASLRVTTPSESSLRRLRFGGGGMGEFHRTQTGDMMRAVLRENKMLTHVHIFVPQHSYVSFGRRLHRAEILPSVPLPLASRLALLSVPTPSFASLDRALLTDIFEWAAPSTTWRRMTVDPDATV